MPSSRRTFAPGRLVAVLVAVGAGAASAQQQASWGFALERLDLSAAGAGWIVGDALDMEGTPGGAVGVSTGWAHRPLLVSDGQTSVALVQDQAFVDFAAAATWDRFRLSLDVTSPLWIRGQSGTVAGVGVVGPALDLGTNPDWVSDARLGVDARLFGGAHDPLRLGVTARLFVPNGWRSYFDSDATFRGQVRAQAAGDAGRWSWAGHVGVHLRPLDLRPLPWGPRGSELIFAAAGGVAVARRAGSGWELVVGPEVFGATALEAAFQAPTTAVEALLGARLERLGADGGLLRVRAGGGLGLNPTFGAPQWRLMLGVELSGAVEHTAR